MHFRARHVPVPAVGGALIHFQTKEIIDLGRGLDEGGSGERIVPAQDVTKIKRRKEQDAQGVQRVQSCCENAAGQHDHVKPRRLAAGRRVVLHEVGEEVHHPG